MKLRRREYRTCHLSEGACLAPAGYRAGNGVFEGEKSCRGTCCHCGQPVCSQCSRLTRRGQRTRVVRMSVCSAVIYPPVHRPGGPRRRVCHDCWRERYEREA